MTNPLMGFKHLYKSRNEHNSMDWPRLCLSFPQQIGRLTEVRMGNFSRLPNGTSLGRYLQQGSKLYFLYSERWCQCCVLRVASQRGLLLRLFDPFRPPFVTPYELSLRSLSKFSNSTIS